MESMGKNNSSPQGFIVRRPDQLKQKCERAIRRVLNDRNIGFDDLPLNTRNRKVFMLRGANTSRAQAKYSYSVVPILQAPEAGHFWLGVTIEFIFQRGNYLVEQVSLVIFRGVATDEMKTPILRAEWDTIDANGRSNHAQPHWHVYSSLLNRIATSEFPAFNPEMKIVDFAPEESTIPTNRSWEESAKFHFAMASRWHQEGGDAHQELLEQEKLLKWLEGCISYVRNQLIYIYQ